MHRPPEPETRNLKLRFLLLALLLTGCGGQPAWLAEVLPGADALPGWTPIGEVEIFDRENIYDLVNGQAEAFFAYGFEQVAVRGYDNVEGVVLSIEVWQLAATADAYGLFTASIAGTPVAIGNDGDTDPSQVGIAEASVGYRSERFRMTLGRQGWKDGLEILTGVPHLDQVKKTGRPVLLTRRGRAVAVLLDLHEYEKLVDRARFVDAVEQGISAASSGDLHPNKKAMKILDTFGKGDGK